MSVRGAESMFHGTKKFLITWIFFNKIKSLKKKDRKKTYFKIRTRWGSRARLKALLTIAACRDVVERVRSMCTHLSLISAPGHSLHQPISLLFSPLYISHLFSVNVFLRPFLFFSSCCFLLISSLHLFFKIKMFMAENSFFLFSFLCFYSHFPNVFLVKEIWWQKTKLVIKINEWRQWWEWSPGSEKSLFLACFWAWPKVWVDGAESNEENALADSF